MKLHTRKQAPKEGEAPAPETEPYITTHQDYLRFLIDSQHVYQAFEEIVNERPEFEVFRDTGLERTKPLEEDIEFMCNEYGLERKEVGQPGKDYVKHIREMESVPELVCHYYNHYFAHTAGGRMIGKKMSSLLLDKKTLEFYKVRLTKKVWHA
jgi:heme oxygenase